MEKEKRANIETKLNICKKAYIGRNGEVRQGIEYSYVDPLDGNKVLLTPVFKTDGAVNYRLYGAMLADDETVPKRPKVN